MEVKTEIRPAIITIKLTAQEQVDMNIYEGCELKYEIKNGILEVYSS